MQNNAQEFYGATYHRAKDQAKLDGAFSTFKLAMNATTPEIQERAMKLACKKEMEAFA